MRIIIASLWLSAALLASCSRHSDMAPPQPAAAAKQPTDDPRVFLTNFGTLSPRQSAWSVQVDQSNAWVARGIPKSAVAFRDAGMVTTLTTSGTANLGVPNWHPQSGWFAHISADERVWVYDGQTNLFIVEAVESNGVPGTTAFEMSIYPRPVLPAVRSRLSAVARQLLRPE
jgi:hypothetical protein